MSRVWPRSEIYRLSPAERIATVPISSRPTRFGADTMRRSFGMSFIVIAGVAAVPPLDCAEPPGRDG